MQKIRFLTLMFLGAPLACQAISGSEAESLKESITESAREFVSSLIDKIDQISNQVSQDEDSYIHPNPGEISFNSALDFDELFNVPLSETQYLMEVDPNFSFEEQGPSQGEAPNQPGSEPVSLATKNEKEMLKKRERDTSEGDASENERYIPGKKRRIEEQPEAVLPEAQSLDIDPQELPSTGIGTAINKAIPSGESNFLSRKTERNQEMVSNEEGETYGPASKKRKYS